ncbi:VapE domain-containing protein, partial [Alloprevotella sp. OH1205_COT-284]|uniref:VapE domain-containing protein n=1 Tax=Alloprevotella sp. OH1205_COT-284 TaxID=2491043 RepID=UPI0013151F78
MQQLVHRIARHLFQGVRTLFRPRPSFAKKPRHDTSLPSNSLLSKKKTADLHRRLFEHFQKQYDFRFNLLTEEAEFRLKDSDLPFRTVDRRVFNTLTIDAVDNGLGAWSVDVERLLHSEWLPLHPPLADYMNRLPEWDGEDRILPLARRISSLPVWEKGFRVWLRSLAAQWLGLPLITANALVPLLVSQSQGLRKSTFCRSLMPPALADYYTEHLHLTTTGSVEAQMTKLGLINLDEFDRFTARQMSMLKNLLQLPRICRRRAYRQQYLSLSRTASFIATSNEVQLLTDLTGSRRFLCIEVVAPIDCSDIDHAQLYAQLRAELSAGLPTHLTREEEAELQAHNRAFQITSPAA